MDKHAQDDSPNALDVAGRLYNQYRPLVLGGGSLALAAALLGKFGRDRPAKSQYDPTIDLVNPSSLQAMMEQAERSRLESGGEGEENEEEEKVASVKTAEDDGGLGFGPYDKALKAMALTFSPALGYYAGQQIGDYFTGTSQDELKSAEEEYQEALMAEMAAAIKKKRQGRMRRFMPKSSSTKTAQEDDEVKALDWLTGAPGRIFKAVGEGALPWYVTLGAPLATMSGLLAYNKFKDESPENKQYAKARDAVERRLAAPMPRMRLVNLDETPDSEEERAMLERARRVIGQGLDSGNSNQE